MQINHDIYEAQAIKGAMQINHKTGTGHNRGNADKRYITGTGHNADKPYITGIGHTGTVQINHRA